MTLEEFKSGAKKLDLSGTFKNPSLDIDCRRSMLYFALLAFRQDTRCKDENGEYLYTLRTLVEKTRVIIKDIGGSLAEQLFLGFQSETQGHLIKHLTSNNWSLDDITGFTPILVDEVCKVLRGC